MTVSGIALGLRAMMSSLSLLFSAHSRRFWPSVGMYACFRVCMVHGQTSVPRGLSPGHHALPETWELHLSV